MADIDEIKRVIQDAGVGDGWRVWIGLKDGSSPNWQWSLADEGFYGENESEFRNWESGRPQGEDCGSIHQDGSWKDIGCTNAIRFICYNGTSSTQPYVLVEDMKTWADAQRHCRENHRDLASVRNQAENDKMTELINPVTTGPWTLYFFWIGLFRDAREWSDGSSSSYRHWKPGEPSYDSPCVEMYSSGLWNDEPCHSLYYFVCYEALPTVVILSPPPPFYSGDVVTLRCDIPESTSGQHVQYVWLKDSDSSPLPGETSRTITVGNPGQYQCYRKGKDSSVKRYISRPLEITFTPRLSQTVRVQLPPGVKVPPDDKMQKALLKQIEDKLKAKGLAADAKLSWKKQPDGKVFHKEKKKRNEL